MQTRGKGFAVFRPTNDDAGDGAEPIEWSNPMESTEMSQHTQALTEFLAGLTYEQIPNQVLARTEDLFLDWLASALASQGAHPIPLFERYAEKMGPADGPAHIFVSGKGSSAYFAALVNGASSHLVEQDDLHNSSVLHPATVVFPAALAAAQDLGKSGRELLLRRSPATRRASASASSSVARTTASSIPPPRSAPWPPRWRSASCWISTRRSSPTCSAAPAPRPRGCGSSSATPPTPSSCTPPRRPPTACWPPT